MTRWPPHQHWKRSSFHMDLQHVLAICFPSHHHPRSLQVRNIHLRARTQPTSSGRRGGRGGGRGRGTTRGGVGTEKEGVVQEEKIIERRGLEGGAAAGRDGASSGRGGEAGRGGKLEGVDDGRWSLGTLFQKQEQWGDERGEEKESRSWPGDPRAGAAPHAGGSLWK